MLTVDYIIPSLGGRLGNNLFMIAHAYAKGLEYNKQVVVSKSQLSYEGNDYSKNICSKLDFIDLFNDNKNYNSPAPSDDKHTIYIGYYQSEKYFEKYSEAIKTLFGVSLDFIQRVKTEIPIIFEKKVTVINVRRGDYLIYSDYHPTVSAEYIHKALHLIPNSEHYLVASDDIEWCKKNLHLKNVTFLEGYKSHEQLWIMSLCHNFIISNSSFSWWAAYLSRNTDKIVIAPETWFGPRHEADWQDVYCKNWIIMPSYYSNGQILPR
jgi:hypothetical protein